MVQDVSFLIFCCKCTVLKFITIQSVTVTTKVQSILLVNNMEENAIVDLMLLVEHVTCVKLVPMIYHRWAVEVSTLNYSIMCAVLLFVVVRMPV